MVELKDGSIICTSYGWALRKPEAAAKMTATPKHGNFVFLGGYHLISKDGGRSWQGPNLPPPMPESTTLACSTSLCRPTTAEPFARAVMGGHFGLSQRWNNASPSSHQSI